MAKEKRSDSLSKSWVFLIYLYINESTNIKEKKSSSQHDRQSGDQRNDFIDVIQSCGEVIMQ
jgi:hypothetical protein